MRHRQVNHKMFSIVLQLCTYGYKLKYQKNVDKGFHDIEK